MTEAAKLLVWTIVAGAAAGVLARPWRTSEALWAVGGAALLVLGGLLPLADAWRKQFPKLRLSCIGKITAEKGLKLRDENGVRSLEAHGYVHFT